MGYPVGLSYPPDWGERTASIRPEDTTVLEAGMTFHFMPALWMDSWGLETTEAILIGENGAVAPFGQVERKLFAKTRQRFACHPSRLFGKAVDCVHGRACSECEVCHGSASVCDDVRRSWCRRVRD